MILMAEGTTGAVLQLIGASAIVLGGMFIFLLLVAYISEYQEKKAKKKIDRANTRKKYQTLKKKIA